MTPVGHSLTGAAIALAVLPSGATRQRLAATVGAFVLLANLPDFPIPGWGHDRYHVSHSLFVVSPILIFVAVICFTYPKLRKICGEPRIIIAGAIAGLSHLLLDTFYNHGKGLAMFWPLSNSRLIEKVPATARGFNLLD
ncbi:MAG: metal-dependent hydrolase [Verrucomicrobiota bacterium]